MDNATAKEFLHLETWFLRITMITAQGHAAYLADPILQEAGDALMMKIGEAANRLSRSSHPEPPGINWALAVANRNFLIHQYDQINREMTWLTLSIDLPEWTRTLSPLFETARRAVEQAE